MKRHDDFSSDEEGQQHDIPKEESKPREQESAGTKVEDSAKKLTELVLSEHFRVQCILFTFREHQNQCCCVERLGLGYSFALPRGQRNHMSLQS